MKQRTFEQIQDKKMVYRKHAERYKLAGYPAHKADRMGIYTSLLVQVITERIKR